MFSDLRFAARQLMRNPGLTAAAVLTLALGIGANTAIFSVINAVLIESLPYPQADQLLRIYEQLPDGRTNSVSGGAFKDWKEHSTSFSSLAVTEPTRSNLTGAGTPQSLVGLMVSSEFLSVLGVEPLRGRGFAAGEDAPGADNQVMLLSHQLWQSRFGGKEDILGRTVALDQIPHTVIGILPPKALVEDEASFLVPAVIDGEGSEWGRSGHWRGVIGRLHPEVSAAQAQAELRGIKERLRAEYPSFKEEWSVAAVPLKEVSVREMRPILVLLLGTVALVLLIACANVSNLLLARGNSRAREMAIRCSLGAGSARILRQMLLESLLLAFIGCGAGLLVALFAVDALAHMVTGMVPQMLHPELDGSVLLFSILVACGCGILFGILPALRASRTDLRRGLKESERGSSSGRRRSHAVLIASEVAFTLVLLIAAGLFLRSFLLLLDTHPGFNPQQALAFDVTLPNAKYPLGEDRLRFTEGLLERLEALPGVESAAASSALPLSRVRRTEFASRGDQPANTDYTVRSDFILGDYFETLEMSLLRGRALTAQDGLAAAPPVLVVDQGLAEDLFPGEDPVGQRLHFLRETWEIVGVVSPVRHAMMTLEAQPAVYVPLGRNLRSSSIVVRTSTPPLSLVEAAREAVFDLDPDQPITNVRAMESDVARSVETQRTTLVLLALFAGVAILLAAIGIYGVMAYSVGQRARELSIRSVLGAERRELLRLILQGGLKPSLVGIGIGLLVALFLARLVKSLLYEVTTHDPLVFATAFVLLLGLAATATALPALRAANADLTLTLRED